MDQERFDNLTRMLASGRSRRTVLGGVLAGLGAGLASVSGLPAQGKKKRKGRVGAEFTCTAANANVPALGGCPVGNCCRSTPAGNNAACVPFETQISGSQFCGDAGGDGVCRTCPPGTRCGLDSNGIVRCLCDPETCAGCCIDNRDTVDDDQCIQNGSGEAVNSPNPAFDGTFVCGTGGSFCNVCSVGTIFAGCCTASGACNGGTTGNNCGNSGELCEECPAGEECGIDQTCTGAGPCGPATCGNGCCDANGACRNGTTDNACGEGGVACDVCSATEACEGQECVPVGPVCPPPLTECNGLCVNLQTNKANCGACGNACSGRQRCANGQCKRKKMMMMMN